MISRALAIMFVSLMLAGLPARPAAAQEEAATPETYAAQIADWRERRHQRLADDGGWMTLVGLEWLTEGENRVGSASSSDARIPGGPADWGTIFVDGEAISYRPAPGAEITVDGTAVDEMIDQVRLVADNQGSPTVVRSGDLSFYVIFRQSYALRIKDRQAPTLLEFRKKGMPVYDVDPTWRIEGRLTRAAPGTTVEIADVLGHANPSPVYGTFEFERDGETYSLTGIGTDESDAIEFMFADRTSGRETYGAGRFVYSDGLPKDGRLVVDFNKAYNPPCAFTDYSTCPLPLPENRLRIAVRAGEKKYHD
jgi:uncharacterized protein (DUF1684 family)